MAWSCDIYEKFVFRGVTDIAGDDRMVCLRSATGQQPEVNGIGLFYPSAHRMLSITGERPIMVYTPYIHCNFSFRVSLRV